MWPGRFLLLCGGLPRPIRLRGLMGIRFVLALAKLRASLQEGCIVSPWLAAPIEYRHAGRVVEKVVCDEKWRKSLMTPCFVASTRNCTTAAQTLKMLDESRVKNESTWAQVRKLTETSPGQAPRLPASHWARRPHPDYQNANKIAWWPAFQKKAASVAPSAASVALPAPTLGTRPKAASAAPPAASADRSRSPRPVFFFTKCLASWRGI